MPYTTAFGCLECSWGQHQPNEGKESCLPCKAGRYQLKKGQSECLDCPAGHFCPDPSSQPVDCPTDSFCPRNANKPEVCSPLFQPNNNTRASHCIPDPVLYITVAISLLMAVLIIASLAFAIACRIHKNKIQKIEETNSLLPSMRRPVKNPDYQGL